MMANYKTTVSVSGESPEVKKKNEEMRRKELDKMKQRKSGKDSNPPVEPGSSGVGHIIDPISPLGTDSSDEEEVQITRCHRK